MSKDYEWDLLRRIAAALDLSPAAFFAERPVPGHSGTPPLEGAVDGQAPDRKRLLDSLRLHKAFESIEDEEARLEALRAVEAISRREAEKHADKRAEPASQPRAGTRPERT